MKQTECPRCGDFNGHVIAAQPHWQLVKCETCDFLEWRSTQEVAQPEPSLDGVHGVRQMLNVAVGAKINPARLRHDIVSLRENEYHLKISLREEGGVEYRAWRYFPLAHAHGYTFLDELFQEWWEWLFKYHKVP